LDSRARTLRQSTRSTQARTPANLLRSHSSFEMQEERNRRSASSNRAPKRKTAGRECCQPFHF
jgi:hypothetical protein